MSHLNTSITYATLCPQNRLSAHSLYLTEVCADVLCFPCSGCLHPAAGVWGLDSSHCSLDLRFSGAQRRERDQMSFGPVSKPASELQSHWPGLVCDPGAGAWQTHPLLPGELQTPAGARPGRLLPPVCLLFLQGPLSSGSSPELW